MRSPAAAIAWAIGRRHRWGLIAVAAYLLVLAALKLLIFEPGRRVAESADSFGFFVMVPMSATFLYFMAVFSFGLAGDLAARESMYPARMFTLPVKTTALAGWPMLYGATLIILLWLATRRFALWPPGFTPPVVWPGLAVAALLAWTQALTWIPYPFRGLRVIATIVLLVSIDTVAFVAFELHTPEPVMLAILAPLLPLAYLAACFGVGRARRGDVAAWASRAISARPERAGAVPPHRRAHFSPARAQAWFEWRQYGASLPLLVAILLPVELLFLFAFRNTPAIVFETLLAVLLTPPFMATFVAATVRKSNPTSDSYGVSPFIASRPMTNASLVAAKLKVSLRSTLIAWLLVLLAVPLALKASGTDPLVIERARRLVEIFGVPRAAAIGVLGLAALGTSTWKQLVQSLYIGMSGRQWAVKASVFLALALVGFGVPLLQWIVTGRNAFGALWNALPWILVVLVCCKTAAAAWVLTRLHRTGVFSSRGLVVVAVCWNLVVFALYGLLAWIVPGLLSRSYLLLLIAILAVPLARLSAAPLALAWNRHR